jgi:hypothetical protein
MARRKSPVEHEHSSVRSATSSELTLEVAALLASIDNLTEFWPKATDGRPVPLGHTSMTPDVAERISQLSAQSVAASPRRLLFSSKPHRGWDTRPKPTQQAAMRTRSSCPPPASSAI